MNTKMLEKAVQNSNYQRIQKKVNLESLMEWAKTPTPELPKVALKTKVEPLGAGIYNFVRQILP